MPAGVPLHKKVWRIGHATKRWLTGKWLWCLGAAVAAGLLLLLVVRSWFPLAVSYPVQQIVESQVRLHLMGTTYTSLPADPASIRQWFQDNTVLLKDGDAVCGIVSDAHLATLLSLARDATGADSAS